MADHIHLLKTQFWDSLKFHSYIERWRAEDGDQAVIHAVGAALKSGDMETISLACDIASILRSPQLLSDLFAARDIVASDPWRLERAIAFILADHIFDYYGEKLDGGENVELYVKALASLRITNLHPLIQSTLTSRDPEVQRHGLRASGIFVVPKFIDLLDAVASYEGPNRLLAASQLIALGGQGSLELARRLLATQQPQNVYAAASGLYACGVPVAQNPELVGYLEPWKDSRDLELANLVRRLLAI